MPVKMGLSHQQHTSQDFVSPCFKGEGVHLKIIISNYLAINNTTKENTCNYTDSTWKTNCESQTRDEITAS